MSEEPNELAEIAATILFFPDAIVSKKVGRAMQLIEAELQLVPAMAASLVLDCELMSELRQYVAKPETRQAIRMRNLLERGGASIYVALKSVHGGATALHSLNAAKGSSFPWLRPPSSIRTRLDAAHPMIKLFHVPDNRREMAREFCLLKKHRGQEIAHSRRGATSVAKLVREVEDSSPSHNLNFEDSQARLVDAISQSTEGLVFLQNSALSQQRPRLQEGDAYEWESVLDFIDKNKVPVNPWDVITVCSHLTRVTE